MNKDELSPLLFSANKEWEELFDKGSAMIKLLSFYVAVTLLITGTLLILPQFFQVELILPGGNSIIIDFGLLRPHAYANCQELMYNAPNILRALLGPRKDLFNLCKFIVRIINEHLSTFQVLYAACSIQVIVQRVPLACSVAQVVAIIILFVIIGIFICIAFDLLALVQLLKFYKIRTVAVRNWISGFLGVSGAVLLGLQLVKFYFGIRRPTIYAIQGLVGSTGGTELGAVGFVIFDYFLFLDGLLHIILPVVIHKVLNDNLCYDSYSRAVKELKDRYY